MKRKFIVLFVLVLFLTLATATANAEMWGKYKQCSFFGTDESTVYAVINGNVYGAYFQIPPPSAIWKYNISTGTLTILYKDTVDRFTMWRAVYNKTKKLLYAVGQYYDGTYWRSVVFMINVSNDHVTYIRAPNTGDCNEFIGVCEYKGYLVVGERVYGGGTAGSLYPDGGGIWFIPEKTITNTSTWRRVWQNPLHLAVKYPILPIGNSFYFLCEGKIGYYPGYVQLWKYNGSGFEMVYNFTKYVDANFNTPARMTPSKVKEGCYYVLVPEKDGHVHVYEFNRDNITHEWILPCKSDKINALTVKVGNYDLLLIDERFSGKVYAFIPALNRTVFITEVPTESWSFVEYAFCKKNTTLYVGRIAKSASALVAIHINFFNVTVLRNIIHYGVKNPLNKIVNVSTLPGIYHVEVKYGNHIINTTNISNIKISNTRLGVIPLHIKVSVGGYKYNTTVLMHVISKRLLVGRVNRINNTGTVIWSNGAGKLSHVSIRPVYAPKNFSAVIFYENINASKNHATILNITFYGLSNNDTIILNETIAKATHIDVLHNGKLYYTDLPVRNKEIYLSLCNFSNYVIRVNASTKPSSGTYLLFLFAGIITLTIVVAGISAVRRYGSRKIVKSKYFKRVK